MKRRLAIGILSLLLAGLQYRLWNFDGGLTGVRMLLVDVQNEQAKVIQNRQRNATLEAEVSDLRAGGAAIEAHARNTLGMIRRGETFYLVVEPDKL